MLLRALVLFAAVARSGDGVPIDYTVEGRGEPALVFVHCWNCDRHFWDAPPEQVDKLLQEMTADYKGQTTKFIGENLFSPTTPPAVRKRVLTVATSASPDRSVAMLRAAMLYDPVPPLGEIRVPIRAINSDKYPTNVEANRRHIPQFDVALMKGAGHYLMLEDPGRFNALLADALSRFEKPPE